MNPAWSPECPLPDPPGKPGRESQRRVTMTSRSRSSTNDANLRLAADIGGTFTDIAVFDDRSGTLTFGKALSTPSHLVDGITAAVGKAGSGYQAAGLFLHGSTIA